VSRGDHDVVVHVDPDGTNWPTIHGRLLDLPVPCSLRTLLLVTAVDDASGRGPREGWFRPDGSFTVSCRPGTYSVSVGLPDGTPLFGARGVVVGPNRDVHPPDLQRKLPADLRLARVRLLDGAGRPLTLRAQSMDSTRYFLLPLGGADVALPYLQPMHLDGDRDITLDPAVVELRIDGLEPIGGWQFGARLCSATGRDFEREVRLEQGRARMLVLRGIAMRIELLAQRYQEQGVQPLTPALLSGFAGGFQVAPGSTEPVVLRAPTDLREQLQALDQQAKSR
jgi:hypothetical protein